MTPEPAMPDDPNMLKGSIAAVRALAEHANNCGDMSPAMVWDLHMVATLAESRLKGWPPTREATLMEVIQALAKTLTDIKNFQERMETDAAGYISATRVLIAHDAIITEAQALAGRKA